LPRRYSPWSWDLIIVGYSDSTYLPAWVINYVRSTQVAVVDHKGKNEPSGSACCKAVPIPKTQFLVLPIHYFQSIISNAQRPTGTSIRSFHLRVRRAPLSERNIYRATFKLQFAPATD
jgi:hypothetical protein